VAKKVACLSPPKSVIGKSGHSERTRECPLLGDASLDQRNCSGLRVVNPGVMLDQPAYVDRGGKLPVRTPHQKNHAIVSAGLMSALGQKRTCAVH